MTPDLRAILYEAWESPFTTKSNFAKEQADFIAIAGFLGLISTLSPEGEWSRVWRLTGDGYRELFSSKGSNDGA